ncbi:hypothetical protein ACFXDJ_06860 [Streptomyces sp. NPDC059443]|uniref:hypothetical protein n=1 Tax=unclassified Streptomyces TaxID=2593676 RepID=UPI0036AB191A
MSTPVVAALPETGDLQVELRMLADGQRYVLPVHSWNVHADGRREPVVLWKGVLLPAGHIKGLDYTRVLELAEVEPPAVRVVHFEDEILREPVGASEKG